MSYDILKNIATGQPIKSSATPREVFASKQLQNAKESLDSIPNTVQEKERYKMWKRSTRDWIPHPDNIEGMWDIEEQAYPGTSFKQDTVNKINRELEASLSDTEKNDYFQRNAPQWPQWLRKKYKPDIDAGRLKAEQRVLGLSRVNNKVETRDIVNEFVSAPNLYLNSTVAKRVHSGDFFTAVKYGFTTEITTDEDGRVAVPLDGGLVPVYALNPELFPAVDPREEYILLNDTFKMIDDIIDPYYSKSESDFKLVEKANKRQLYENIDTMGDKFTDQHVNIILDYAEGQPDPEDVINRGLSKTMSQAIDKDVYNSSFDIALDFVSKWQEVLSTLKKRSEA